MHKRKRNSVTPSKNPPNPKASTRAVPVKAPLNQRGNAGKIEAVEIDLTDDDSDNCTVPGASLPKKKKMEENIKGGGACTRASTLNQQSLSKQPSVGQSSSKPAKNSWDAVLPNSKGSNGNAKYSTAPDVTPPHVFKMPNAPKVISKVSMPPPAIPGPSSAQLPRPSSSASSTGSVTGNLSSTQVRIPKKKQPPTENELKATEEARRLRVAIIETFQHELEKASNGELNDINIGDLFSNLQTCVKMWPNIYVSQRYPQVQESDDRSHSWEIVEFGRWWLFGLTGLFFASPAMNKPTVRENIKMLIRTLCQYLSNGHPTLIEVFVPQLLCILRDLTVVRGGGTFNPTIKIHLPFTKIEEASKKKTKTNSSFEIQITESNEWAIPHYLEAISILFPRIFFYNHQLRHVLLELLRRLSTRLSPASYGIVVMSALHNALMPSLGYLTEEAVGEMICEMMKVTSSLEDFCRELLNHREIGSLAALSGRDGTTVVAVESSEFLFSPDFAMLYNNDMSLPLRKSFQFLVNEMFKSNATLSADMIRVSTMLSSRSSSTLNVVLHPLVGNVIVRELLTNPGPSSLEPRPRQISGHQSLVIKARDVSELWSRIIGCWENALNSQFALIHPRPGQVNELMRLVKFLQNTAALMKLTSNLVETDSKVGNGKYQYFELYQLQRWADVACFALKSMSKFTAMEKHQLYVSILDTIGHLDSASWFNFKLSAKFINTLITVAGWPWLNEFSSHIPPKLKPLPPFTENSANLQFIKNSYLLMAKAVSALRLEIFRPWSSFVLAVYSSVMSAAPTIDNPFLLTELLSAISTVSWPFKKMPLGETFLFLTRILLNDVWKVDSCVRSGIGDAIAALPCICCHSTQNLMKQPGKQQQQRPLESGCRNCSIGKYKYQGAKIFLELKTEHAERIISLATPILQSIFLSVKFRLIELIIRCNNHMKNPSAVVAMSLVTVAVKGKAVLSEEIFRKIGQILTEGNNTNLETGCPMKLEVAQKIFRVALPKVCGKLLQEKKQSKLSTCTRLKILLGIQELSTVGLISLSVFVEIMNFMLVILSQTKKNDMTVLLLCQKIVTNFAEMHHCAPLELITRVRSEIAPKLVKIAIKQFYQSSEEDAIGQCSSYIEMLKSIGSFSFQNTFAKYIYPTLMEQIVPKLHTNPCYPFLLSAVSRHANDPITITLQETVIVWYPTILLDHSVDTMTQCLKFLSQKYKFDAMFVARQQEQRILNEALCRLDERKDKLLRSLNHLCKWDDSSSQQILSQGSSKSPPRSEIQELLDKRMLGFFLQLDTKIKSRIETVEMKKKILRSFVALIKLMGKTKMTPLRSKAYQTLNSVTEQGPVFYDVMYEAWKAFADNLDNESFASMTCPILAAVLCFREIPSMRPNVDRLISHFVCFKKELTSVHHAKLYFLLNQCDDHEVNAAINEAVTSLKQQRWSDYFNMLVEEAGHSNSHIRYQAFRKLNDVFDQEAASVEKFVLAKGEQNVSRVISTLLAGLRGAAGGKPEEDKMRLVIAKGFGNLGALDPFRFRNIEDDNSHNRSRRRTGLVISAQITAFCLFYVQELIREFRDAKDATSFDYCVCLIRNLFQDFNVKVKSTDPIWSNLSKENQEIILPMLTTKYALGVEEILPKFSCPIYLSDHGKCFDDWLLNWLTVMIKCIKKREKYAYTLFVKNVYLLRKNARIAAFIIPFVALHSIFCADNDQLNDIIDEMKNILERWTILENRKVQNSMAIRDSEAEVDIFEEPMSVENESVFHFRCTQVIFSILDHLLRSLNLAQRRAAMAKKANDRRPESQNSPALLQEIMTPENMSRVEIVLRQIPRVLISQVAFDSQSSATALFYIEQELKHSPSNEKFQKHLDYLQRIYVSLNDMDSVLGISALRDTEPSSHERVLENIAEGKVEDYLKNIEQMTEQDPSNLTVNYALVQAYLSVDEPTKAQNTICAILARQPEWEVAFQDVQMESLIKLKSWDDLKSKVERFESYSRNPVMDEKSLSWNIAVSRTISKLQSHQFDKANEIICTLRERLVAPLVAASEELHPYTRAYDHIVQLHILAEIEDVVEMMRKHTIQNVSSRQNINQNELRQDMKNMMATWDSRLMNVSKSRKIVDQILNVRKSVFEILKATFQTNHPLTEVLNSSIRECWLDIAQDSNRCANFIRADKALLEAKKFLSPKVLIEEAKILARKGNKESAVAVLQKGINQYFPNRHAWKHLKMQQGVNPQELESRIVCSKALLLLAKLCEEQKLLDKQDYIDKYKEASDVYKESEKNFFTLGSYFDRLWSKEKGNCDLQVKVCQYYSHSLLYGCKYVYQSLPRLLSIWFDHAASVSKGEAVATVVRMQGNSSNSSSSSHSPILISPEEALRNMEASIKLIVAHVPPYVLMTAFSQLISRLCHSHSPTWVLLKNIIVLIIKSHPYQTLWMTMAVHNSVFEERKKRCMEVYKCVEKARPDLKNTIKDYCTLTEKLLVFCEKSIPDKQQLKVSLGAHFAQLPKLIRGMGKVLIPFQIFMNPLLPQKGFSHKEHDPYPETPVYISDIDDNVDVMTSLIRPKKITLIASNGKRYALLCKPKDDLRKDSKVMEVNNVVNWYLRQNAESSSRRLHVRAYSVVALNEECGLLEWVPNLQTKRILLNKLYRENNIITPRTSGQVIPKHFPLEEKIKKFQEHFLKPLPPVFSQWFFNNFDDHQSWYVARMSYTRTAAVMSIVGYIMGLGDRHGENLLLDTVTGEVVHVDFNCLFNKGETFEYAEKVPFRLTQNMVDAMGSLKYEGVFRRSCEITMNMFRTHQNVFLSVFRPFVYDPLVEWQKPQMRGGRASMVNGEMTNEKAVDTMNYIRCRLNGTGRVMMKEIDTELSVEAHVKFLIDEATSLANLCQMYFGWAAHM